MVRSVDDGQAGLRVIFPSLSIQVAGWVNVAETWIAVPPIQCPLLGAGDGSDPLGCGKSGKRFRGGVLLGPPKGPGIPEFSERWASVFFTGSLSGYPYRVSWQILPKVIAGICQRRVLAYAQGRFCPRQIFPKVIAGIFEREPIPISRQLASLAGHLFDRNKPGIYQSVDLILDGPARHFTVRCQRVQ